MHVYVVESSSAEEQAKISVHEYMHVLQQGFLNEELISVHGPTPLRNPEQDRFQLINLCGIISSFVQEHLDALNALPNDMKLFDVPTYIILYPYNYETNTPGCESSKIDEYTNTAFNTIYGSDCSGMASNCNGWNLNENHVYAEGEAEYFALNVYTSSYSTFDGSESWRNRLNDGKSTRVLPGNINFKINLFYMGISYYF